MLRTTSFAIALSACLVATDIAIAQDKPAPPSDALNSFWQDLADDDPIIGSRTIQKLAQSPKESLAFLKENLHQAPAHEGEERNKRIAKLIVDLKSEEYKTRKTAAEGLGQFGMTAVPALRMTLEGEPSLDLRRWGEQLIDNAMQSQSKPLAPDMLRTLRALEVLECIGTPEAKEYLKILAAGDSGAYITQEAAACLKRIARK